MNRRPLLFLFLGCLFLRVGAFGQSAEEKKNELGRVRREMEETRRVVDSLRDAEAKLVKHLNDFDTRISKDQTAISKIGSDLKKLRARAKSAEERLDANQNVYEKAERGFTTDVVEIYMQSAAPSPDPLFGLTNPNQESEIVWRTLYLSDLSGSRRRSVDAAGEAASQAEARLADLTKAEREAQKRKRRREATASANKLQKEKSAKSLTTVREKREKQSDRLLYLSETARQMTDIIAKLEAKAGKKTDRTVVLPGNTGAFQALQGRLVPPIAGEVSSRYGWKVDPISKLKSYSPGITIDAAKGFNVRVIADGVVVYVGFLRGYDNFVIVQHDDGYYSTYGGLSTVAVAINRPVASRDALGVSGSGVVKFELRRGKESVDPAMWLDFSGR